ncbi:MAG: thermonuclease family protein [Altererythrobacter sp.]
MGRILPFRRNPAPRKRELPVLPVLALAAMLGTVSGLYLFGPAGGESRAAVPTQLAALPSAGHPPAGRTIRFSRCGFGSRKNCVVDGDTVWLDGEKIRLSDINTPEISDPGCAYEKQLGERATERLVVLLNSGQVTLVQAPGERNRDQYDRLLRELHVNGASVGDTLVREGLAEEWQGWRRDWC